MDHIRSNISFPKIDFPLSKLFNLALYVELSSQSHNCFHLVPKLMSLCFKIRIKNHFFLHFVTELIQWHVIPAWIHIRLRDLYFWPSIFALRTSWAGHLLSLQICRLISRHRHTCSFVSVLVLQNPSLTSGLKIALRRVAVDYFALNNLMIKRSEATNNTGNCWSYQKCFQHRTPFKL